MKLFFDNLLNGVLQKKGKGYQVEHEPHKRQFAIGYPDEHKGTGISQAETEDDDLTNTGEYIDETVGYPVGGGDFLVLKITFNYGKKEKDYAEEYGGLYKPVASDERDKSRYK